MSMISEIVNYLNARGIGTAGTDLFYSYLPDTQEDVEMVILDRTGPAPDMDITDIKSPMFQVFIRAKDYTTGKDKLDEIRAAFHGKINTYLFSGGIKYRKIKAMNEGGHLGRNENGRDEFSINFLCSIVE